MIHPVTEMKYGVNLLLESYQIVYLDSISYGFNQDDDCTARKENEVSSAICGIFSYHHFNVQHKRFNSQQKVQPFHFLLTSWSEKNV